MTVIVDLKYAECKPSCPVCGGVPAPAQISMHDANAGEALERDPARYCRKAPAGVTLGPHVGTDRLIFS
jgi:hypothetical protein